MKSNVDLIWVYHQLQHRFGLTGPEACELICAAMIAGKLTGLAEKALRYPFSPARDHFTSGDGTWKDFVVPASFWNFIDVDWEEQNPVFHFRCDQSTWIMYKLQIERNGAYAFLRSQDPAVQAVRANESELILHQTIMKNKGGRPPKYDWDACLIEAVRWMTQHGRPKTQAKLFNHMAEWFGPNGPGDTQLKQHLRLIYRDFRPGEPVD